MERNFATASFRLLVDNNSADNLPVLRIDAYNSLTNQILANRLLRRRDFATAMTAQDFDLVFELDAPAMMEFRVYAYGSSYVEHQQTVIRPDRLALGSLWNGNAHFEPRTRNFIGNTSSIVALDGAWYAFVRQVITVPGCDKDVGLQTAVTQSWDHGATWSPPVVALPATGVGADACVVTDGGAFFDTENDTWHMLYQCLAKTGPWNLCHYTRQGISPQGPFIPDPQNPVVRGGQIWSQICAGAGKACDQSMVDEGTVQIIRKTGPYFYLTFHGATYPPPIHGARGVARTADFIHYEIVGPDLPGNAMLAESDCNSWGANWNQGHCIGFGDASLLRSGGYNYMLAEAADLDLRCTKGQNWFFGLLRNPVLGPSGTWENFSSNPMVMDSTVFSEGCSLQYMTLLRDRGEIFLHFGFYSSSGEMPNQTYQLVNGSGPGKLLVK